MRERAARKEAESELEAYSQRLYRQEQQYKLDQSEIDNKQIQLEFLTGLLAETWRKPSLKQIIENYLERTSLFMVKAHCLFIELTDSAVIKKCQFNSAKKSDAETNLTLEFKQLLNTLERKKVYSDLKIYNECKMYSVDSITKNYHGIFSHSVMLPLYESSKSSYSVIGIIALLYVNDNDININKLQTLESSRSMLSVAIERKRSEEQLQQQLIELADVNQALEQTQQQLLEQEKLASLGLLAAGVAHEINNPVGFVLSNLDTMHDYVGDMQNTFKPLLLDPGTIDIESCNQLISQCRDIDLPFLIQDSQEILKSSVEGLERVKTIVSDLSTFSRMDNDELEPIDLSLVVKKSLNMVTNEFKYKHQINSDLLDHAQILGSEGQLQQVLINLFMNAKHAMQNGGTLNIHMYREKNKILLSIKDEGHGIKKEHLKDIFTPFFTTKAPGEGTGLGLAISYSILQQHSAKVKVNSEVDKGTEFLLTFFELH